MKTNLDNELAYDYGSQEWLAGIRAVKLKIKQLGDSLALLTGENAEEYARFAGIRAVESHVECLRMNLERLRKLEASSSSSAPLGGLVTRGECVEVGGVL